MTRGFLRVPDENCYISENVVFYNLPKHSMLYDSDAEPQPQPSWAARVQRVGIQ